MFFATSLLVTLKAQVQKEDPKLNLRATVPKVDCTAPWGRRAVGITRGPMEVGPSERIVLLFTTEVISDQTL
jgi:hypothetical protein